MGMLTSLRAYRSANDPEFKNMKAVYDACRKASITLPKEVDTYFNGGSPEESLEVELQKDKHYHEGTEEYSNELIVNLNELPMNVTKIVFGNYY